jgi:hypothetical protein
MVHAGGYRARCRNTGLGGDAAIAARVQRPLRRGVEPGGCPLARNEEIS